MVLVIIIMVAKVIITSIRMVVGQISKTVVRFQLKILHQATVTINSVKTVMVQALIFLQAILLPMDQVAHMEVQEWG